MPASFGPRLEPPAAFDEVARWVLDAPAELPVMRHELTAALDQLGAHDSGGELDSVAAKMILVASELATNAILHGLPPTVVRLMATEDELLLEVADRAPEKPPVVALDRQVGEGGLGLQIAERMALGVGWYNEGVEKRVWATFERE